MGKKSHALTAYLDSIEENMLCEVTQSTNNPLTFNFCIRRGHPKSEELIAWFEEYNVGYLIAEHNPVGWPEEASVNFSTRPDLATLFKLRYC